MITQLQKFIGHMTIRKSIIEKTIDEIACPITDSGKKELFMYKARWTEIDELIQYADELNKQDPMRITRET